MRKSLMDYTETPVTIPSDLFQPMLIFTMALSRYFQSSGVLMGNQLVLHGQLLLDNKQGMRFKQKASVIVEIATPAPLSMPTVYCLSPWVKCGSDWHIFPNGWVCWEKPEIWKDLIGKMMKCKTESNALINFAATWCMNSVISLLCRHWYAHRYEIKTWPPQWKYWPHC